MTLRLQVYPNMLTKKETSDQNKISLDRVGGIITPFCITIRRFKTAN